MKQMYALYTVLALVFCASVVQAQITVSLPDLNGKLDRPLRVAVDAGDLSDLGIFAYLLGIEYDPAIVRLQRVIKSGSLSANMVLAVNDQVPGRLTVGGSQAEELAGEAPLLFLDFELIAEGESRLDWRELSFNEGEIAVDTVNGRIGVSADAEEARIIGSWTMPLVSGKVSETVIVPVRTTDLEGEGVFAYRLTFSVDPQVAQLIGVSTDGTLSEGMEVATHSVERGRITLAASGVEAIQGTGDIIHVLIELVGQGTSDVVFRDVLLNEGGIGVRTTDGSVEARIGAPGGIAMDLPVANGEVGEQSTLVVNVDDLSTFDIASYFLVIYYDADILRVLDVSTENTLSADMAIEINVGIPGQLRVAAAQTTALQGGGTLLNLQVAYVGPGTAPLRWANVIWNDGFPEADPTDGEVRVSGGDNDLGGPQIIRTGSNSDFSANIGPEALTLEPGQQVRVEITASEVKIARNALITAQYNPDIFTFQGFEAGDLITGIVTLPPQTEVGPDNSEITKAGGTQLGLDGTPGEGAGVVGRMAFLLTGELPPEGAYISIIELQINATSTDKDIMAFGAGTLGTQVFPFILRPGDFNGDGRVDSDDFFLFSEHFDTNLTDPEWDPLFDIVQNGTVDYSDLFLLSDLVEAD